MDRRGSSAVQERGRAIAVCLPRHQDAGKSRSRVGGPSLAYGAEPRIERPRSDPPITGRRSRNSWAANPRSRSRFCSWRIGIPLSIESQGLIFRIGRRPDPWQPPDWSLAGPEGTFGNRFDDPDGTYRVLYASSERLGCYLETLARFRVDLTLYAELSQIEGSNELALSSVRHHFGVKCGYVRA